MVRTGAITITAVGMLLLWCPQGHASSVGINFYGLSYHLNGRTINEFNEINQGMGINVTLGSSKDDLIFFEIGSYKDSFKNTARYISVGYILKVVGQLRAGVNTALYNSKSFNYGRSVIFPIPIISYRFPYVTVSGIYLPKYYSVNPYNTLGAYVTIRFWDRN